MASSTARNCFSSSSLRVVFFEDEELEDTGAPAEFVDNVFDDFVSGRMGERFFAVSEIARFHLKHFLELSFHFMLTFFI